MTAARAITAAALLALAACNGRGDVEVTGAYVERALPGSSVSAGYFVVQNRSAAAVTLTGADSASATAVELHEHVLDGDMMRMRKLDSVPLAPGERTAFAPGGRHLMIYGLDAAGAPADEKVVIRLTFADHPPIAVEFAVRERTGESG